VSEEKLTSEALLGFMSDFVSKRVEESRLVRPLDIGEKAEVKVAKSK
jgi:hypothetical protein